MQQLNGLGVVEAIMGACPHGHRAVQHSCAVEVCIRLSAVHFSERVGSGTHASVVSDAETSAVVNSRCRGMGVLEADMEAVTVDVTILI